MIKSIWSIEEYICAKFIQIIIGLALYFVLCRLYSEVVVNVYSFGGFVLANESRHELVIPVLELLLIAMPTKNNSIESFVYSVSLFFILIPAAVLCALQGSDFMAFLLMSIAVLAVSIFFRLFSRMIPEVKDGDRYIDYKSVLFWLPFAIMATVLAFLAIHVNFTFRYSFSEVYEYRFDFNDSLRFPLNYLLPFAGGPLVGFLAALSVDRREWAKLILVIFCGILFYGFSTHKAFLFYPFFAVAVYFAFTGRVGLFYTLAIIFLSASVSSLIVSGSWSDILGSLFANRIVFIPAQIHFVFFEEFAKVGHLYWAESKISLGLIKSPIPINSVNYIAEIMTGDAKIGANVGWLANGYMNSGMIGIFGYAAIIGLLILTIDRLSKYFGRAVSVAAFSVPLFGIVTSNDLLVAMLTGGILPMLLLLWLLLGLSQLFKINKNVNLINV